MKRLKRKNFLEKIPKNAKLVARPSRWGNPNSLVDMPNIKENLEEYEKWLEMKLEDNNDFLKPLYEKDLVCYCALDQPCHADILISKIENFWNV